MRFKMSFKLLRKQKSISDLLDDHDEKSTLRRCATLTPRARRTSDTAQESQTSTPEEEPASSAEQSYERSDSISNNLKLGRNWLDSVFRKMSFSDKRRGREFVTENSDESGRDSNTSDLMPTHESDDNSDVKEKRISYHSVDVDECAAIRKRGYVMRELIETERDYVRDLGLIVNGYLECMRDPNCDVPIPKALQSGKDKIIFGNLEAIYEWHRDRFLNQLEECFESPENLGALFKNSERKLEMYIVYCKNKPMSEFIVAEYVGTYFEKLREKLGYRLQLPSLLIKPIQRITKYGLLLKDISKYTERAGPGQQEAADRLKEALQVMQEIPKAANDMMSVSRLQEFKGSITAQGRLLMHGELMCHEISRTRQNSRPKQQQVLLFERCIIFSDIVRKKNNRFSEPVYVHKANFLMNKLRIAPRETEDIENHRFTVINTDDSEAYACIAESKQAAAEWVGKIQHQVQIHSDLLQALVRPITYQNERTRTLSTTVHPNLRKLTACSLGSSPK